MQAVIDKKLVKEEISKLELESVGLASIRELNRLVLNIEERSGESFIRMEIGVPGLKAPQIAIDSEIKALQKGVGATYPPFDGIVPLKKEISKFIKNFMNIDVASTSCFPTVGSMQGCYMGMMVSCRRSANKNKVLFIDPGFPVNKRQAKVIGLDSYSFDIYDFRGEKLRDKLESYLSKGDVGAILYSNPNNPAWFCLKEKELQVIGELATKYDAIVLEDLAYFGMDFRQDYGEIGQEPYISTVARYTDNYILIISSSKSFTMAGQRVGMSAISDKIFNSLYEELYSWFGSKKFGNAYLFGALYAISSGVTHSSQYGLLGLLQAVNSGEYKFLEEVKEYGIRAGKMKQIFKENGFYIVYDKDVDEDIADGFYFTIAYPGFTGKELVEELIYYGISGIAIETAGSSRTEGVRACVSLTDSSRFADLTERLQIFNKEHKNGKKIIEEN